MAQAGKYRAAWEALIRDNPLPAVHGRVCYHPCETSCNRKELDSAVSIHAVERFLGDLAMAQDWPMPVDKATGGKRVLVVGAGPSGLSAAYHLTRLGHQVEIHDAGPLPGGMLHFGIPAYRLPREELMKEIGRIEQMGVSFVPNHRVDDVLAEQKAGGFDAVFIAIGAQLSKHVDIPARDAIKVLDAVSLLRDVEADAAPRLGRRVVIYGGGNTAMDVARTVRRLGASEAMIVYRRDRAPHAGPRLRSRGGLDRRREDQMADLDQGDRGRRSHGRGDAHRRERPRPADRRVRNAARPTRWCWRSARTPTAASSRKFRKLSLMPMAASWSRPNMMTGRAGIFAGGDMVPTERSVTIATGHGKKAAHHIDAWLRGEIYTHPAKHPVVEFAELNLPIYADAARSTQRELPVAQREGGFDEVVGGLSEKEALHEAKRCLSCGNCFECDNCLCRLSGRRHRQARPERGLRDQARSLHRLRRLRRAMPLPCHGNGFRADRGQDMNAVIKLNAGDTPAPAAEPVTEKAVRTTMDGNTAVAHVAYRVNEVCAIYPITPSSTMAELADQWAAEGLQNIWGNIPLVQEMQSEGGASGTVHGALQSGAMTTTFTSSQGLMLMLPNMMKIAGELTSTVFHVAARSLATSALSIFGDHSDVMTVRTTGFALISSANVQEAHDTALIAEAATLQARVPFLHFFDGFRTSHELNTLDLVPDASIRAMISDDLVRAHRLARPRSGKSLHPRHRAEPRHFLPGPGGSQPVLRQGAGNRRRRDEPLCGADRAALPAVRI